MRLRSGIPSTEDYESLVEHPFFRDIERFSSVFLSENHDALKDYRRKWVDDPLHQWSRQWEYPFVLGLLIEEAGRRPGRALRVLDAGSGVTFFPHLVASRLGATVACVDYDPALTGIFAGLRGEAIQHVTFSVGDLHRLTAPVGSIDAICCISVLEHTRDYQEIIREFRRVLAPAGLLVVTFDISRDGRTDIAPAEAERLLEALAREFDPVDPGAAGDIAGRMARPDLVTTGSVRKLRPELLPWKATAPSGLRGRVARLFRPGSMPFYDLTFDCQAYRRRPD
jgi:SAM-dependent methyltransferase